MSDEALSVEPLAAMVEPTVALDAVEVFPDLWFGAQAHEVDLVKKKFDVVYCVAKEHPRPVGYQGRIRVVHSPLDDFPQIGAFTIAIVRSLAKDVADEVKTGHRTIITCHLGRNRSALIAALALIKLTKIDGLKALERVRQVRPNALFNETFVSLVKYAR